MAHMKHIFLIVFLFICSLPCFCQEKNEWVTQGDAAFKNEDYKGAIAYYLKVITKEVTTDITRAYEIRPSTRISKIKKPEEEEENSKTKKKQSNLKQSVQQQQYIIHQLADAYRLNHDYKNAEIWFKKSIESKPLQYPYDHFWYGDALLKNGQISDARSEFELIVKMGERKNPVLFQQAKIKIKGCSMAENPANTKNDIKIIDLDSLFNGGSTSFSCNYYGDVNTIQFTNAAKDKSDCDMYTITKSETGWNHPIKFDNSINSDEHEAAGCLSPDKNLYYFTRWSKSSNECAIYISKMRNQQWLVAEKLSESVNMPGFKSMHPSLSKDGTILYFSSNRPGGYGKMDLWYIRIDEKGKTEGRAINMGAAFNTTEDEISPFFHAPTYTLYFSSNGLQGFGGLDVFKSYFNEDSLLWSTPRNMGIPVNSNKDDAYFIMEPSQRSGFFSSDRKECETCVGAACYKLYAFEKKTSTFRLHGYVYNAETNRSISDALVTFKDIRGESEPFQLWTDSLGEFSLPLQEGQELYVKAQKNGFFGDANTISTVQLTESQELSKDFFLSSIPQGDIIIPGIEYENNKATLKPASISVLNELAEFLTLNNNLKVEISSHTDERGNDAYNLKLSIDRANACVKYLVSKGIASDRLIANGYGETQPLVSNAQTEAEHQRNRRTVLRTLSETKINNK